MNSLRLSTAILRDVDPDEALVYLQHINQQCERIVALIDELRDTPDSHPGIDTFPAEPPPEHLPPS